MVLYTNDSRELTSMIKTFVLDHLYHIFKSNRRSESESMGHFNTIVIIPTVYFITSAAYFNAFLVVHDIGSRCELISTQIGVMGGRDPVLSHVMVIVFMIGFYFLFYLVVQFE